MMTSTSARHQEVYSVDDVETACCIWEWMTDQFVNTDDPAVGDFYGRIGSSAARMACIVVAPVVSAAWRIKDDGRGFWEQWYPTFDWDFVPAAMAHATYTEFDIVLPEPEILAELLARPQFR